MHVAILNDPANFHTRKWALALQRAGARVTVFSFDPVGDCPVPAVQIPSGPDNQYRYRDYLRRGPALRAALEAHDVDVANALNVTPFGVWAHHSGFQPVIASALGADLLEYPPRAVTAPLLRSRSWANVEGQPGMPARLRQWLRRQYFRPKVRRALQSAALVTGDNQLLVDAAQDWFGGTPEKTRLLRWGVEPELFEVAPSELQAVRERWQLPEDARVILSPRGAKAIYNADIILEAFARVLATHPPDVHCILLGAGYAVGQGVAAQARKLAERYPNFHFEPGRLPREEVYALWNLVDIFVSTPIYDGYSAALAEGRYIGAVPVVNAIPGNLELIRHQENGWIIDPLDPDRLAMGLTTLLEELEVWQARFSEKNRRWIEKHSLVDTNARTFLTWCAEILGA